MRTPFALLRFIAKAAQAPLGGPGDHLVEALPDVSRDVWKGWAPGRSQDDMRGEVQALATAPPAEIRQEATVIAADATADPARRLALVQYLCQVPAAVR